jgi:small membrane protein
MIFLRIIATLFVFFAASRAYLRFKDRSLSMTGFIFWTLVWLAALVFIFFPDMSSIVAGTIGLGRGVDAVFLLSIVLLFYLVFRLYIKIDTIDKNITDLTIRLSKILHEKNRQ